MAADFARICREVRTLESYSGLESADRVVFLPADQDELAAVFAYAGDFGRKITLHGGGHSFDAQAIGDDLVVSLERWNTVYVEPDGTVLAAPGATWGDVFKVLAPRGMVPPSTVTTRHATIAGTLSGNCLSRFSPVYGKEGEHVVSFELMTPDGAIHSCEPPPDGGAWTNDHRLLRAAIGGLGYIGAFLQVRFKPIAHVPRPIRVRTTTEAFHGFGQLEALLREVPPMPDPGDEQLADAIYAAVPGAGEDELFVRFKSSYTTGCGPPLILYEPDFALRPLVEWLMRDRRCNDLIWAIAFGMFGLPLTYVNGLEAYTFFMDGDVKANALARRFGRHLKTLQQTFIVPVGHLAEWMTYARDEVFSELDVAPTLQDVMYLPQDLPFYLSSTARQPGFAVSYAFDTSDREKLRRVTEAFVEMSDTLLAPPYESRVYLVKNVRAKRSTIAAMYGPDLTDFRAVKAEFDSNGILRNGFYDRLLA
jgi:decaprenylphospho-beta-D-ribofuranose 2-oxidase